MKVEKYEGMAKPEIKSFKNERDYIELYTDKKGNDMCIAIPKWMFNQIVEKAFVNVQIAGNTGRE